METKKTSLTYFQLLDECSKHPNNLMTVVCHQPSSLTRMRFMYVSCAKVGEVTISVDGMCWDRGDAGSRHFVPCTIRDVPPCGYEIVEQ